MEIKQETVPVGLAHTLLSTFPEVAYSPFLPDHLFALQSHGS